MVFLPPTNLALLNIVASFTIHVWTMNVNDKSAADVIGLLLQHIINSLSRYPKLLGNIGFVIPVNSHGFYFCHLIRGKFRSLAKFYTFFLAAAIPSSWRSAFWPTLLTLISNLMTCHSMLSVNRYPHLVYKIYQTMLYSVSKLICWDIALHVKAQVAEGSKV